MTNLYITIIKDISHKNKYTNWYINIIEHANTRCSTRHQAIQTLEFFEAHHILPKSFNMGGEKDPDNLTFLTYREHFLIHMLLPKMVKDKEISYRISSALTKMNINNVNSKTFNTAKIISKKYHSSKLESVSIQRRNTLRERYGVEHNSQLPEHVKNVKHTNNKRFGFDFASQSPKCKEKSIQTNLEKYGVEHPSQLQQTKEKRKHTNLERYGSEFASQNPNTQEKTKQTNLERYNVEFISQYPDIQEKISIGIKLSWENKTEQIICPYCNKSSRNASIMTQYHFDNCKLSPSYISPETIKCIYCNKIGSNTHQFKSNHFDNCKLSLSYISPESVKCPHCDKCGVMSNMTQWHFDNCKHKL